MKTYILTKKEVGNAIVWWIDMMKEGQSFFPYFISDTAEELHIPENVMLHLEMIPKGAKESEYEHNL